MDGEIVNLITQSIGAVGFPIVACCYMAWMHNDSEQRHSQERREMTDAINRNSTILELIKDRLDMKVNN